MAEVLIKAEKLRKAYTLPAEEIVAVNDIDLEIQQGDFVAMMGPSGSGKTTLLDVIGCLDTISGGKLTALGRDVSNVSESKLVELRRKGIGFVFQEFLLISTLTALENVELPLHFARIKGKNERAKELLNKVGLGHRLHHLPKELSGGERQRVAVARALVTAPKLLLADEPTGNLDTKNSQEIFSIFKELNQDEGITIVVATHNKEMGAHAGRIIHLRDGKIVSDVS